MIALKAEHLPAYLRLMRVDRPIGSYLVAWPALWSLWIAAEGIPDFTLILVFLAGSFLMRSAGCAINDYADRNLDGQVERTRDRPLAAGDIEPLEALQLFACLCLLAALLLLFTNWLTAIVALAAVALTTLYPFTKRFTQLPQVILGMAFSCSIPMAFAAQTGSVPAIAWPLYTAVVLWVIAYDTFYAMVDRNDDIEVGIKSTAILFGKWDRRIIAGLQCLFLALMFIIGSRLELSTYYNASLLAVAALFVHQQVSTASREREKCFRAFLNNNYVGMIIFIGLVASFL